MADGSDGNKNEIIAQEWTSLEILWERNKQNAPPEIAKQVEDLFRSKRLFASSRQDWYDLNRAEQLVGSQLQDSDLKVEYRTLLEIARARKTPGLQRFEKDEDRILAADAALLEKRATYLALLQTLQGDFIEGRFQRRLRGEAAWSLFGVGSVVAALAILVLTFTGGMDECDAKIGCAPFGHQPGLEILLVAIFGILGAYFSRLLAFQTNISTLEFDDFVANYQERAIWIRLLYGMIGAIVFYLILQSQLIGGTAFPDFEKLAACKTAAVRTVELTKLLVWSFLAGFSERLLSDALDRVQGRANTEK